MAPNDRVRKLIAAQHTRAYVTGDKNGANDAAATAGARSRAATKCAAVNTEARQALVEEKMAMACRLRTFVHEYGKALPPGAAKFRSGLTLWPANGDGGLSAMAQDRPQRDLRLEPAAENLAFLLAHHNPCFLTGFHPKSPPENWGPIYPPMRGPPAPHIKRRKPDSGGPPKILPLKPPPQTDGGQV